MGSPQMFLRNLLISRKTRSAASLAFACTSNLLFLVIAGTIGVISPVAMKWDCFSRSNRPPYATLFRLLLESRIGRIRTMVA